MSNEYQDNLNVTQSAYDVLTDYAARWLESKMRDCEGQELARLIALLRVADMHAQPVNPRFPLPFDPAFKQRITHGVAVFVPKLLPRVPPGAELNRGDTNRELAAWAETTLNEAGALSFARRAAFAEKFGLSVCRFLPGGQISIAPGPADLEAQENLDRNTVNDWERILTANTSQEAHRRVLEQIAQLGTSYKGLSNGALVIFPHDDAYFTAQRKVLELNAREYLESESFPNHVRLGPLAFGEWKQVAVGIAAHISIGANQAIYAAKRRGLAPRALLNLLPRFLDEDRARNLILASTSAVDASFVDQVLEVFTTDAGDAARFEKVYMPPPAMMVRVPGGYVVSHNANMQNPYWYMTEKLKTLFRDQWRNAASDRDLREVEFRKQLYAVLPPPAYVVGKNTILRQPDGKEITDIDATLYERATNVVYLFQLKWPDVSAGEWNRRRNETGRLVDEGVKWINGVFKWFEQHQGPAQKELLAMLELDKAVTSPYSVRYELVVITRSWARFAGMGTFDSRAAWTSWTRLRKLIIQHSPSHSPLKNAWTELCDPKPPRARRTRPSVVELPELTLSFDLPSDK